jgi:hypothetical protein
VKRRNSLAYAFGRPLGRSGERLKCACGQPLPRIGQIDWMEWQAGYVSGALVDALEPGQTPSRGIPPEYAARFRSRRDPSTGRFSSSGLSEVFDVSREAAEVRLLADRPFDSLSNGLIWGTLDAQCLCTLIGIAHFQYSNTHGTKTKTAALWSSGVVKIQQGRAGEVELLWTT